VKALDPYDSVIVGFEEIHSLSIIHEVTLSPEDANANIINVASNIPLPYEDKLDGCKHLKEKKGSFT
jgi:hypothetical protein